MTLASCSGNKSPSEKSAERTALVANARTSLNQLTETNATAKALADQAKGILVFPEITEGGLIVGGKGGDGVLFVNGQPAGYYNTGSVSFGLQAGVQSFSQALMFMTDAALSDFRNSSGWEAGVDGQITLVSSGAEAGVDTSQLAADPMVGFVYGQQGLMGGVSLEGSKYSRLEG